MSERHPCDNDPAPRSTPSPRSDLIQAGAALVWILACVSGAFYCLVVGQFGLFIGLMFASLALPIALPVMHR